MTSLEKTVLGGLPSLIKGIGEGLPPEECGPVVTQATKHPLSIITRERRPHVLVSSMGP